MADDFTKKIPVDNEQEDTSQDLEAEGGPFADVKKEIRTRFELLPEDIQKAIMDDGYQMKLFEIAKAQKLTYEELGSLEMETTMVLLGMTSPEDYRDELQVALKKNDPLIDSIVNAVNEQVFTPIRSSLERVYAARNASVENTSPEATPTRTPEAENLSTAEKNVLETSGVVISDTPVVIKPPIQSPVMPTRTDILKGIENPPRTPTPGTNIAADKLTSFNQSPAKTTDYTIPKTTSPGTQAGSQLKADPYRESVE